MNLEKEQQENIANLLKQIKKISFKKSTTEILVTIKNPSQDKHEQDDDDDDDQESKVKDVEFLEWCSQNDLGNPTSNIAVYSETVWQLSKLTINKIIQTQIDDQVSPNDVSQIHKKYSMMCFTLRINMQINPEFKDDDENIGTNIPIVEHLTLDNFMQTTSQSDIRIEDLFVVVPIRGVSFDNLWENILEPRAAQYNAKQQQKVYIFFKSIYLFLYIYIYSPQFVANSHQFYIYTIYIYIQINFKYCYCCFIWGGANHCARSNIRNISGFTETDAIAFSTSDGGIFYHNQSAILPISIRMWSGEVMKQRKPSLYYKMQTMDSFMKKLDRKLLPYYIYFVRIPVISTTFTFHVHIVYIHIYLKHIDTICYFRIFAILEYLLF